jgi:lipoic acid synthetase
MNLKSRAFDKIMNIKHAVITSVDRDDLKDGGSIWIETESYSQNESKYNSRDINSSEIFKVSKRNIDRVSVWK